MAQVAINELDEITSISANDLLVIDVDNGDGTYTTEKVKYQNSGL
jgi:hypothetical protein